MNQASHPQSVKQVLLLINSGSRLGEQSCDELLAELAKRQIQVIHEPDRSPSHYTALIQQYEKQVDALVVGGGDGTVSLCLQGLMATQLPMAVIPLGTANNLARNLDIPASIPEACQILMDGNTRWIDVAMVNDQYFLNVVGLGLSTQVNHWIKKEAKKRFGVLAYVYYALKITKRLNPFTARITFESGEDCFKCLQVSVCNGRYYGAGFIAEQNASIDDGLMDVVCTMTKDWTKSIRIIKSLMKGAHHPIAEIKSYKLSKFTLQTKHPMSLDVDGDVRTKTPAVFKMSPKRLQVFTPSRQSPAENL